MFSYSYDKKTGGILLNTAFSPVSKAPRPVYAAELNLLGFSKYWIYENQNDVPYLWAESNQYYYRGQLVAKTKGGDLYNRPEILLVEETDTLKRKYRLRLKPIDLDAMVKSNREMLDIIEQRTARMIKEAYEKRKNEVDCFEIAYSGGKDSAVLFDLVKKTLPLKSFVVVFGDTGMEFPDTYNTVNTIRRECEKNEIPFYIAKSELNPFDTWKQFGPPSRVLRWCCSVHKSTPQILKLREIFKKKNCKTYSFVGVRHEESQTRSEYEYECYGKKQKGQYSFNPLLEWTSAEIWLYILANGIEINEAYKKGCARVGCICCPMGGGRNSFIERKCYPESKEKFLDIIKKSNAQTAISAEDYTAKGGWNARKNGRYLTENQERYSESTEEDKIIIDVRSAKTDWKEWIKPLGTLIEIEHERKFSLVTNLFDSNDSIGIEIIPKDNSGYTAQIMIVPKNNPAICKLIRYAFRKAAYCLACKTCQSNCRHGCISFENGLQIKDCKHCLDCFDISAGCLAYDSLKIPSGEGKMKEGINCFSNHAPQNEWFEEFFNKEDFLENNTLGPVQKTKFKRFLKDAGLITTKGSKVLKSDFSKMWSNESIGSWSSETYLGLILINLLSMTPDAKNKEAHITNPQFRWYVSRMDLRKTYTRKELESMLEEDEQSEGNKSSIINALSRFSNNLFGTVLHFCQSGKDEYTKETYFARTHCKLSDSRVLLYSLYRFSEDCGNYKSFRLSTLMDETIERSGVSPFSIFGFEQDIIIPMLNGLSTKYPDYINVSFTHDLEKISLAQDKTHADVLNLFE